MDATSAFLCSPRVRGLKDDGCPGKRRGAVFPACAGIEVNQIALTPVTLGDPAFDATGLLRTDLVANRCASAMPVVHRFESQYVGVTAYKGHPVHDRSMAVAFALLARKRAFRQGCETKQQLQTARSGYRKIEAEDLVIATASDILRHVIPIGWSHGPVTAEIYAASFGDKNDQ